MSSAGLPSTPIKSATSPGAIAPIESANPWRGIFAAVHRAAPGDGLGPWLQAESMAPEAALSAYTLGPALAAGRPDLGHLRPGAHADLAVLNVDLDSLLAADERQSRFRIQTDTHA